MRRDLGFSGCVWDDWMVKVVVTKILHLCGWGVLIVYTKTFEDRLLLFEINKKVVYFCIGSSYGTFRPSSSSKELLAFLFKLQSAETIIFVFHFKFNYAQMIMR